MASLRGWQRHYDRLGKLSGPDLEGRIAKRLFILGQKIEITAEKSITKGAVSGKGHVPSAPGQPPNADTHTLDRNIETTIKSISPPVVRVTSNAPYGLALEYGTSRMAERPYMRPAMAKHKDEVIQGIKAEMNIIVKGS